MAQTFQCTLVTPERSVFDAAVVYANIPAHDGQLGVLANRAPIVVALGKGRLKLEMPGGAIRHFDIQGGFAQMNRNRLTLLSEKATDLESGAAVA